ncbi:hypothetical protein Scep_015720 [Stephania cephalantha]|uniref:Protein-serine/threonine phosphatase n=1 Tax=Stephania cephalantha TaxID=152367 RepID=A0AAP0J3Q5_9MAGN
MSSGVMKMVTPCWKPYVDGERGSRKGRDDNGRVDGLLWYKDLGCHVNGEFSMAVIQANNLLEDQSQVESGPLTEFESGPHGTFVGIYDGHGGPETSRFINQHLFNNLKKFTSESRQVSADAIRKAFLATEEEFLSVVKKQWLMKPQIASVGSCCLGIARRLVKAALREAAKKREMRYSDLKKIDRGVRRHFHDDITVVVLFLDTAAISKSSSSSSLPAVSIKGGGVSTTAGL